MSGYVQHLKKSLRDTFHNIKLRPAKDISVWALISARFQPVYVQHQRIDVLRMRVVITSYLFSVLAILWGVVDYFAFPRQIFFSLLTARLILSAIFVAIALFSVSRQKASTLVGMIAFSLALLTTFYFLCSPPPSAKGTFLGEMVFTSYSLLPFILFSGLGFFPITVIESVLLIVPMLTVFSIKASNVITSYPDSLNFGSIWIMMVLGCIATLTSLSQLRLLIQQVSLAAYDTLTGCLCRKYGEHAIEITWNLGKRYNRSYTIAYFDLDHFKSVNDQFGHQQGDNVLSAAAMNIRNGLRASDFLVRWGGEEFLIILPDTEYSGAVEVINRLYKSGFGLRPDGMPQLASIGIAERLIDNIDNWRDLARIADERLYIAKTSGRNKYIGPDMPDIILKN